MTKRLLYIGNKLSKHGKTPTAIENLGPLLQTADFEVIYSSNKLNKLLRFLSMIYRTIRDAGKVDYVLIDTYSTSNFWYAFAVSQICRILKAKYIPILHGGNLPNRLLSSPSVSRMIFENAYAIVAPSKYLANSFAVCGFTNIHIIGNPISLTDFPFKDREYFHPKLLWVRSLADIYNPKLAIDVLDIVQRKFPTATLTMVGPDNENMLSELKEKASDLELNVAFSGRLTRKGLVAVAQNHDIFLNTTNVDNTPASMIEAAALGLAIVSTNVGGIPFLFQNNENALLVDPNDAVQMSDAVIKCCQETNETIIRTKNALELANNFSPAIVLEKWQMLLV